MVTVVVLDEDSHINSGCDHRKAGYISREMVDTDVEGDGLYSQKVHKYNVHLVKGAA